MTIVNIFSKSVKEPERSKLWQGAAAAGLLFQPGGEIPEYDGDSWFEQLKGLEDVTDSSEVLEYDVFKFLQASSVHRTFVLRDLLPSHGLLVR